MNMFSRTAMLRLVLQSILSIALLMVLAHAPANAGELFKRIPTQYIAALGKPDATAGKGAERWGLWRKDPGPRGVWLRRFNRLKSTGGVAPAKWKFDSNDWWLDENGLIMEKPEFALPPGKYLVTGDREALSVLTVHPMDDQGAMRWELGFGAKLYDVTHLPCRSARYRPDAGSANCTPDKAKKASFPVKPGHPMPDVPGCRKQDYAVLFVVGKATQKLASRSDNAACRSYGMKYPGLKALDMSGSLVLCSTASQAAASGESRFMVRQAEMRRLVDVSQHPRCDAKQRIEALCATKELCKFEIDDTLCANQETAQYTTHMQIVWRCRAEENWRFNRVERGRELVLDCSE